MRYLYCCKSIKGAISRCQKLQNQVKPAPKIHIVDFKRIEEEKQKKNGLKTKKNYTKKNESSCN